MSVEDLCKTVKDTFKRCQFNYQTKLQYKTSGTLSHQIRPMAKTNFNHVNIKTFMKENTKELCQGLQTRKGTRRGKPDLKPLNLFHNIINSMCRKVFNRGL